MIKNYFKIALRNLKKHKAYAFINISGLALSMACGILIFTLVSHHLNFDNFHSDPDRIYRVVTEQHRDQVSYTNSVPSPLGFHFRKDYSYAEKTARVGSFYGHLITVIDGTQKKKFQEESVACAEPEYFDIFNYPLVQGDKKTALLEPGSAIITEKLAKKYFGTTDAVNRVFKIDNRIDCKVTGILKDLPVNTDRHTEIFLSYENLKDFSPWLASADAWGGIQGGMQCFVKLKPGMNTAQVENAMQGYVKQFRPTSKNVHHYKLQPLGDIHFNADYGGPMQKRNLWVLTCIAIFLIATACINFINLATAQAMNRAKEIGIRKVLGSLRGQLFWQFITETFFITLIAAVVATGLAMLVLPLANDLFTSQMNINPFTDSRLLLFIVSLIILVTLLAGSYPGMILSGFRPIMALKSKVSSSHIGGLNTRRSLIVLQFAISQVLIIGMIVIAMQMRYSKQSDMGFDKDEIVMLPIGSSPTPAATTALKARLSAIPGVQKVTLCSTSPASQSNWTTSLRFENRAEDEVFRVVVRAGDEDYANTFGLHLSAGRNMFRADTVREALANEMLAQRLNLTPQQLIGKTITINGDQHIPIVGVVQNFHDQSFHEDINPVIIPLWKERYNAYAVKISAANIQSTLAALDKTWSQMYPDELYEYQFLDEHIAEFYETEDIMLKLIQFFSLIAILIGCFGLYGLVSFIAAQKTKEIGIRKVLGGTLAHILWLFGKEFSRLIIIAFLIAAPIAWWLMNNWLKDFEFKITISVWIFLCSIGIIALVTALTVGYQSLKASLANPVKSLRTE